MAGQHDKRLSKVEHSLTLKQAMLLWLEEAQQHGSLQSYARWLKEQPDSAYPLARLPRQVRQAVHEARKGQPREQIAAAVQRAERDVIFLFKLFMGVNTRVLAARKEDALGYLPLAPGAAAPPVEHGTAPTAQRRCHLAGARITARW